jgi:hypothetical protein
MSQGGKGKADQKTRFLQDQTLLFWDKGINSIGIIFSVADIFSGLFNDAFMSYTTASVV